MIYTRRDIGRMALAALPAAQLLAKPNSKVDGVQLGINVPYSYGNNMMSGDETLKTTGDLGFSAVELRTQPIEQLMGSPAVAQVGRGGGGRQGQAPLTPEQQAARSAAAEQLKKWRLARSTSEFKMVRKKFEDAGVAIQIVKVDWIQNASDDLVEYCFLLAKTVGAHAISCEIPLSKTKWLGSFADKHKMMVGYHGHTNITDPEAFGRPESWETAMSYAKYNGINLDIGHFIAANNTSPVPFLQKYHQRVTHVHVKDRKMNNGPNAPFGQGDTPIKEVLQVMKRNKWKFQATIEFEYKVPEGSTRLAEIAKCLDYCKAALA